MGEFDRKKVPINKLLAAVQDFERDIKSIPPEVEGLWASRQIFVSRAQDKFRRRMRELGIDDLIDYDHPDGEG